MSHTLISKFRYPVEFHGKRITINEISPSDGDDFLRLSADFEGNKYWGYDCREDKNFTMTAEYFLSFVQKNKDMGEEYSLAIRYNGSFAGELVFHNFDNAYGVEMGARLLPEFRGLGIATEAFLCGISFAYDIGARKITAKCFIPNTPSYNMLKRAGFSETSRDDTFIYFEHTKSSAQQ